MKRVALFAMLAFTPACSLTGWGGDNMADPAFQARASGKNRALTSNQLGFIDINGDVVSYSADVGKFNGSGDPKDYSKKIHAWQQARSFGDHGGFDQGYSGVMVHKTPSKKPAVRTHETGDTNKDGFVSGNFNEACGILVGLDNTGSMPGGAFFLDDTACVAGVDLSSTFSTGTTEGTDSGGFVVIGSDKNKEGPNGVFDRLPFSTRVALMNSVNTATDVKGAGRGEILTVRITSVRVGSDTYAANATVDVVGLSNVVIDPANSGLRLLAAFVADKAGAMIARGQKPTGSVTINNAVTLTLDQLLAGRVMTPLSPKSVEGLRRFASTGGLIQEVVR